MSCPQDLQQSFLDGEFIHSMMCVFTGNDPVMLVVIPMLVYGVVIVSLFLSSDSVIIPAVVSLILGGVMLSVMPGQGLAIIAIAVALFLTVGVFTLARRSGSSF